MDFGTDTGIDAGAGDRGRRRTGTDRFDGTLFFAERGAVRTADRGAVCIAERGTDCTSNDTADCAAHGAADRIAKYRTHGFA